MDTVGILLRAGAAGRDVGSIADQFDRVEVPAAMAYALAPFVDIPPTALGRLADEVKPSSEPIPSNELYARLSAVAQPGYADERVPLHPARAVADVRAASPTGGVVVADPGVAGLWVARTFPTTAPGSVVVPAVATPGIAAALGLVAALRGIAAIAVTTEPLDPTTLGVLELATELGTALTIDVWGASGPVPRVEEHLEQLRAAVSEPGVTIVHVPLN